MTPDEILQALKNQRFWPNPDTLDEDLHNAIALIQQLCEMNAKYVSTMMEMAAAVEDINEEISGLQ